MITTLLRAIDFETTGDLPDAAVCEIGWCDLIIDGPERVVRPPSAIFVDPKRPLSPASRGIHHISDEDVTGALDFPSAISRALEDDPAALIAHQAKYEQEFLDVSLPWICTYKVASRIWPDAPDHKAQTLRYYLDLDRKVPGFTGLAMPPHRGGPDAFVAACILSEALAHASVEEMIAWTKEPAVMRRCPLKAHRGQPWSEVPADYLDWIVNKPNEVEADAKWNAKRELDRRLVERRNEYVAGCKEAIAKITDVTALAAWWDAEAAMRADLGIGRGSPAYEAIAALGRERKNALQPPVGET